MTGGFAIVAYPAEYRNSGIMTFLVGTDGIIYQKDLGEKTLNGIAYDAQHDRLFVTGKQWPTVFEIKVIQGTRETSHQ